MGRSGNKIEVGRSRDMGLENKREGGGGEEIDMTYADKSSGGSGQMNGP